MKTGFVPAPVWLLMCFTCCVPDFLHAQQFQLVTGPGSSTPPPAGGGGDSTAPIISRDGRHVVFASTANNLVFTTNGTPIPEGMLPTANVFLRDRQGGKTELISVNLSGAAGGNGDSFPVDVSPDGRYVLFESAASDLVAGDTNNASDVFVRDRLNGTTLLVSANPDQVPGNRESRAPAMTSDGRYVAFVSAADDLVTGDTNRIPDVFVRDTQAGTTVLASVGASSRGSSLYGSEAPEITPDGRYVLFYSAATNLAPGVPSGGDIYVRDLAVGSTVWASSGARTAFQAALGTTNVMCYNQRISDDGKFVVYQASFGNAGTVTNAGLILRYDFTAGATEPVYTNAAVSSSAPEDILSLDMTPEGRFVAFTANANGSFRTNTSVCVWDAQSGSVTLASADLNGQAATTGTCHWPTIDPSGRYVAFISSSPNLVTNALNPGFHLYVRDLQTAAITLVDADRNSAGVAVGPETRPQLSENGRLVVFEGPDGGLVQNDSNRTIDAFVSDWAAGAIELVSAHDPALPAATPTGPSMLATTSVSHDGRFIAFASEAENLTPNDTNRCRDVFVRDLATGVSVLASTATNGFSGDRLSTEPAISPDGRFVAFSSLADDLVPRDNNRAADVFIRDLRVGTVALVSANRNNTGPGNAKSYGPIVSRDGRYVLFRSVATDLAPNLQSRENLFLRDCLVQTNYALTTGGMGAAAMTPDGRLVVYSGYAPSWQVQIWDSSRRASIYSYACASVLPQSVAFSTDGRWVVFSPGGGLHKVDVTTGIRSVVDPSTSLYTSLRLSADGRLLACVSRFSSGTATQVYLYDLQTATKTLVSRSFYQPIPANDHSDQAEIRPDGQFIAYRSFASDIFPRNDALRADIYLYDVEAGTNAVLTTAQPEGSTANNGSLNPVFTGDGRTLFLQSLLPELTPRDFNRQSDIFAYPPVLYVLLLPADGPGQGPWLSWPSVTGKSYRVEYKNSLAEAAWQPLDGVYTNSAGRAWLQDPAPNASQRIYRVLSY